MRYALAAVLLLILAQPSWAQEPKVLTMMWEDTIVPAIDEKVTILMTEVEDINADGVDEAVVVTSGIPSSANKALKNRVKVYTANGSILWEYGVDSRITSVLLYDLDNDRRLELLVASGETINGIQRGALRIIGSDGDLIRTIDTSAIFNVMAIGDINSDRYYEIAAGSGKKVYFMRAFGEILWTYPPKGYGNMNRTVDAIAMRDMTATGVTEVLFASDKLYYLDYNDRPIRAFDAEPDAQYLKKGFKEVVIGKVSRGNFMDAIAVTNSNVIYDIGIENVSIFETTSVDHDLLFRWNSKLGCDIRDIKLADIDSDELDEVLVACASGRLYALDNNGGVSWVYPLDGAPNELYLKDVDDDNVSDILIPCESGSVYLLDLGGNFKWREYAGAPALMAAAGDMNNDNSKEVVVLTDEPKIKAYRVNETYSFTSRANALFSLGQAAYIQGDLDTAKKHIDQAKSMYLKIGYGKGVADCQRLLDDITYSKNSIRRKEADMFYSKAYEYYFLGDYENALTFVDRAAERYREFLDNEGIVKCELLKLQVNRQLGRVGPEVTTAPSTQTTLPAPEEGGGNIAVFAVLALLILLLLGVAAKRRKAAGKGGHDEIEGLEEFGDLGGGGEVTK
jgi:tetratricopeptide (TPR) repeat protein